MIEQHARSSLAIVHAANPVTVAPSLVVAIGAAEASGLAALKEFFIALDEGEGAGMAFIVLQHLDTFSTDDLPQILEQFTELPVSLIRSGDRLEPDHVFVAPAGTAVTIEAGVFELKRLSDPSARRRCIDMLFRSVADAFGERAAGIVLAGTGNDGTIGAQMIARAGGIALTQEPARVKCAGVPRAVSGETAGEPVMSPFQMPEALLARSVGGAAQLKLSNTHQDTENTIRDLRAANAELERFNRELLAIHGKFNTTLEALRISLEEQRARNDALAAAHASLSSLLSNTPLAIIFLNENLLVEGFTRDATHIYDIQASDLGTPLESVVHRAHDMPALPTPAELRASTWTQEDDVITADRWYLRRALPRFTREGQMAGMVVTFIDVTKLKSSEAVANPHDDWLRSIIDTMPTIISYVDDAVQRN